MPTYEVTDPSTGMTLELTGESPPTEQELEEIFSAQQPVEEKPSFPGAGFIEPAATLISGAIAEPIAGIAGLAKTITSGPEAGTETIEAVRKGLTFQPRTEAGQERLGQLGEVVEPIGRVLQEAETFLGDETFEATGSPTLAAAATTIPTVLLEVMGLAASKGIVKGAAKTRRLAESRAIKKNIVRSAPEIDEIKNVSSGLYNELRESGINVKPGAYKGLVGNIEKNLKAENFKAGLAPDTSKALNVIKQEVGGLQSVSDIDGLRQQIRGVLGAQASPNDKRLISVITETIDEFLDEASPANFTKGSIPLEQVSTKTRLAGELWGRARRSEILQEAFSNAELTGGNLTSEFKGIVKNKRIRRFFKPEELEVMREVAKGSTSTNVLKAIGRFGGPVGFAGGGLAFGAPGATIISGVGAVSKKLAQKLTARGANFADAVIRAGTNADDIVKAYLKNVPKAARKAEELSELLLRPDIALDNLLTSSDKVLKTAAEIARGKQILAAAGTAGAAGTGVVREMGNQEVQ
jgi:hypothetical protein